MPVLLKLIVLSIIYQKLIPITRTQEEHSSRHVLNLTLTSTAHCILVNTKQLVFPLNY
jgi:hypothetical protein